jgi:hypothetical protein
MIADTGDGTPPRRLDGGIGFRAVWQWTHSMGSAAVNGKEPVSIW